MTGSWMTGSGAGTFPLPLPMQPTRPRTATAATVTCINFFMFRPPLSDNRDMSAAAPKGIFEHGAIAIASFANPPLVLKSHSRRGLLRRAAGGPGLEGALRAPALQARNHRQRKPVRKMRRKKGAQTREKAGNDDTAAALEAPPGAARDLFRAEFGQHFEQADTPRVGFAQELGRDGPRSH